MIEGDFGENVLVYGIDFKKLPVGTKLICNDVKFEVTQIGKSATVTVRFTNVWETALCQEKEFLQKC